MTLPPKTFTFGDGSKPVLDEKSDTKRPLYTLEFKLKPSGWSGAARWLLSQPGLGIPKQALENWVMLEGKGKLKGGGDRPVSAEQMSLTRLRAELARVRWSATS